MAKTFFEEMMGLSNNGIVGNEKKNIISGGYDGERSYGKWKPVAQSRLTDEDKNIVEYVDVVKGELGPTACFHFKNTNYVKVARLDFSCEYTIPVGAELILDTIEFIHYSDGEFENVVVVGECQNKKHRGGESKNNEFEILKTKCRDLDNQINQIVQENDKLSEVEIKKRKSLSILNNRIKKNLIYSMVYILVSMVLLAVVFVLTR